MAPGHRADKPATEEDAILDGGFRLVVILTVGFVILLTMAALGGLFVGGRTAGTLSRPSEAPASGGPSPSIDVRAYLEPAVRDAPEIALTGPDAQLVTLASMQGGLVLVFFGYTHCPDVCPTTIGVLETAIQAYGPGVRAVFVTVDPERDTPVSLKDYLRYLPAEFTALTGSTTEIRATADAWGVRYARVDSGSPGAYSMSHTADVYVVDAAGRLRARFPFGTSAEAMTATLRSVAGPLLPAPPGGSSGSAPGTGRPAASAAATPATPALGALVVDVTSSSIWAGGSSPVILALTGPAGRLADTTIRPSVQLTTDDGSAIGGPSEAIPVRPPGIDAVSYVAQLDVPTAGRWRLQVSATPGVATLTGKADVTVLDPGATAPIGAPAPTARTLTLDDVAGDARQLTTDPIPDLRLYRRSTGDALGDATPFVLVLDSAKFRVTTACGKALIMARYLQDRWADVAFIHHEPFRYSVVTDTPVLEGTLAEPQLTAIADAWGIGGEPWGPRSMPWVFVVDGHGLVRAKYQGVLGSDDIDVIVALITQGG